MIRTYGLKLGNIFGIPFVVDITFIMNVIIMTAVIPTVVIGGAVNSGIWIVCAYISLVFHELAHAATSFHFGVKVNEIRLHVLGATGVPESEQKTSKAEILTALAGPAMSILIGSVLAYPLIHLAFTDFDLGEVMKKRPIVMNLGLLVAFNYLVAVFNLTPLYPMDGGRILRGILTIFLKNGPKATRVCAFITIIASFAIIVRGGYGIATHHGLTSIVPIIFGVALANYAIKDIGEIGFFRSLKIPKILRRRGPSATTTTEEEKTN